MPLSAGIVRANSSRWFPTLFFASVALGTLPVIFTHLFVSPDHARRAMAAIAGREYADVQLAAFARHPWLVHSHAVVGLLVVLTAPFQFWRNFRTHRRRLHRVMGYFTVGCLVLLACSGLAVAIAYPFSGVAGMVPNAIWMTLILFAIARAIKCIRRRDMWGHETWMTRAMAVTLGITFASLYLPLLNGVLAMPSRTSLAVSFWLGVVECLCVGEMWLRRPGRPGRPAQPPVVA